MIVDVQSLQATKLPGRHGNDFIYTDAEDGKFWCGPPVFFLPGSQTVIFDKQVFSCASGRWTLRHSARAGALPFSSDAGVFHAHDTGCHNLVARPSGFDVFFSNLGFAYAVTELDDATNKEVLVVRLQGAS